MAGQRAISLRLPVAGRRLRRPWRPRPRAALWVHAHPIPVPAAGGQAFWPPRVTLLLVLRGALVLTAVRVLGFGPAAWDMLGFPCCASVSRCLVAAPAATVLCRSPAVAAAVLRGRRCVTRRALAAGGTARAGRAAWASSAGRPVVLELSQMLAAIRVTRLVPAAWHVVAAAGRTGRASRTAWASRARRPVVLELSQVLTAIRVARLVLTARHMGRRGERWHNQRQRPEQGGGEKHPSFHRRFEHAAVDLQVVVCWWNASGPERLDGSPTFVGRVRCCS